MYLKTIISSINSWNDFKSILETKTKLEKGKAFEELTKYYLECNDVYADLFIKVWLQKDIPSFILKKINIPSNDQGIDIIAETKEGTYWAIQCKYLQDEDQTLTHRAISTFVSLSTGIAENIAHCLVCTTVDNYAKIYKGKQNITFCNSDEFRKLNKDFFDKVRAKLNGQELKSKPNEPKPHQLKALKEAKKHFITEKNTRGKLIFPCGAGKSLTGYWITLELNARRIIVAVPSLSLVKQTLEVYLRETRANNDTVSWLCVCSDEGIGKNDDVVIHTNEIGVPCVTNKTDIAKWLSDNSKKKTIIFTTYQSGKTIAEACQLANYSFDLGIMDEAHKTVGQQDKLFSHLLFEKNIQIQKRIFMTATERRYAGSSNEVLSMNDVNVYGETFTQMSFKEAIDVNNGILCDYKIITLFISNTEVRKLIEQNAYVKPLGKEWYNETEARTLASLIALRKAMTEYPIHHAVTFHSSIKKALAFEQSQAIFSKAYPEYSAVKSFHVSGEMSSSERGRKVDEFAETKKAIITNAKCLTEGVDVPNIDCVLFADPRKSTIDIVQAVGRALRKKSGKDFGYVILPVFTESNISEEIVESDEFKEVLITLRALAANDERIIDYFRDVSKRKYKNKKDSLIQFNIDINIAAKINEKELIDTIELKTWNKLAKLSWMPFMDAIAFAQKLKLKSRAEWEVFCKTNQRPFDMPVNPDNVYKKLGWINWGDFLGNGAIATRDLTYLPFNEARNFVRNLGFKSGKDYFEYCKTEKKPKELPRNPGTTYKNDGWIGMNDWLGTEVSKYNRKIKIDYRYVADFAQKLNFKSVNEWRKFVKSGNLPIEIPTAPHLFYKGNGWISWSHFLGCKIKMHGQELDFEKSREFARSLKLNSNKAWRIYCKREDFPNSIPTNPDKTYRDKGWINWADWLGSDKIATNLREYKSFEEAKLFARKLKINSSKEWMDLYKQGKIPKDIPKIVYHTYLKYWKGWSDFLGKK